MRFTALFNAAPLAMMEGYKDGDDLLFSDYYYEVAVSPAVMREARYSDDSDFIVCSWVFAQLNADDRKNRATERSLSVGDVIQLRVGEWYRCYAIDPVGFRLVGDDMNGDIEPKPIDTSERRAREGDS